MIDEPEYGLDYFVTVNFNLEDFIQKITWLYVQMTAYFAIRSVNLQIQDNVDLILCLVGTIVLVFKQHTVNNFASQFSRIKAGLVYPS
ncbi:hypothetical protein [Vibrio sp.]|uniref:hypothetical protein n=1 Tax=Vibrio sp. TaxID=678 RepID=UPI00311D7510